MRAFLLCSGVGGWWGEEVGDGGGGLNQHRLYGQHNSVDKKGVLRRVTSQGELITAPNLAGGGASQGPGT